MVQSSCTNLPWRRVLGGRARAAARDAGLRARPAKLDLDRPRCARATGDRCSRCLSEATRSCTSSWLPRPVPPTSSLEDVARGLGLGRIRTFIRVTLHQIRPAPFGGSLLVSLILLAEFGTFEILRFQTFTTQIYTGDPDRLLDDGAGCALSCLVLVSLPRAARARRRGRGARASAMAQAQARPAAARRACGSGSGRSQSSAAWPGCSRSPSACRSTRSATGSSRATSSTLPLISTFSRPLDRALQPRLPDWSRSSPRS